MDFFFGGDRIVALVEMERDREMISISRDLKIGLANDVILFYVVLYGWKFFLQVKNVADL